jgi:hypothetical protein
VSGFGWSAQEYPGDTSPWHFVLYNVRCRCGWFLAKATPLMSEYGVRDVEGICKRHGKVIAESWDIIDARELSA